MNYRQHIIKFYCFCAFLTSFYLLSGQSADITESCPNVEIDFVGPDGLSEYFWDFKDGGFSDIKNPAHLFLGTPQENSEDAANKGRTTGGDIYHRDVLQIRLAYANGITREELREVYQISKGAIYNITVGKHRKHAGGPIAPVPTRRYSMLRREGKHNLLPPPKLNR